MGPLQRAGRRGGEPGMRRVALELLRNWVNLRVIKQNCPEHHELDGQ